MKAAESFQVITLFGSRQVGKTTTVDHLFGDEFGFVTLDDFDELTLAHSNPKAFFESHPWPLIIDEVQKEAGLLNEIKKIVDEQRRIWMRNGEQRRLMFVLTGSNQTIVPLFSFHPFVSKKAFISKGFLLFFRSCVFQTQHRQVVELFRTADELVDILAHLYEHFF
ncbi:MAG: AAA family ATPase, partial [Erysipelotrichaceae bacterium]|nr:AAA family ATPase [Erysipelotrichaceae bacterium]